MFGGPCSTADLPWEKLFMKRYFCRLFFLSLIAAGTTLLSSCNSGEQTSAIGMTSSGRTYVAYNGGPIDVFFTKKNAGFGIGKAERGIVIVSTEPKPKPSGKTGAVRLELSSDAEQAFKGQTIYVRVTARPYALRPSSKMAVVYSTNAVGNSNWKWFPIKSEDDVIYEFKYDYPAKDQKPGHDYIGIWPDTSSKDKGIVVTHVEVSLDARCKWPGRINKKRSFCLPEIE